MDKNDFDIDFDFEKEYGFDPEEFLNSENPGDFDLSQIDDLDLDISEEPTENAGETEDDDFDFDLDEEDTDARQEDYDEDFTAGIDFSNRKPVEDLNYLQEEGEDDQQPVGDEQEEAYEEPDHEADAPDFPEEEDDPPVREKKKRSIPLPRLPKLPKRPKSDKPSIFSRFFDLYFGPLVGKSLPEQEVNVGDGRRRRRKPSRMQILKEVYLPPVILCIALVLVLSFAVGSISNTVKLTVFARAKEIRIMKYIGATNWFIRGPFLAEGILIGMLASIVATGLIALIYGKIVELIGAQVLAIVACPLISVSYLTCNMVIIFLALGMSIGAWGSIVSMRRFLDT